MSAYRVLSWRKHQTNIALTIGHCTHRAAGMPGARQYALFQFQMTTGLELSADRIGGGYATASPAAPVIKTRLGSDDIPTWFPSTRQVLKKKKGKLCMRLVLKFARLVQSKGSLCRDKGL